MFKCDERVLKYIEEFGSITSLQAIQDLGETRLSARIYDLKKLGYKFKTKAITVPTRYNKKTWVKKYELIKEEHEDDIEM